MMMEDEDDGGDEGETIFSTARPRLDGASLFFCAHFHQCEKKKKLAGLAEIGHDSHEKTLWSVCKEYRYKNSAMFRTI